MDEDDQDYSGNELRLLQKEMKAWGIKPKQEEEKKQQPIQIKPKQEEEKKEQPIEVQPQQ